MQAKAVELYHKYTNKSLFKRLALLLECLHDQQHSCRISRLPCQIERGRGLQHVVPRPLSAMHALALALAMRKATPTSVLVSSTAPHPRFIVYACTHAQSLKRYKKKERQIGGKRYARTMAGNIS